MPCFVFRQTRSHTIRDRCSRCYVWMLFIHRVKVYLVSACFICRKNINMIRYSSIINMQSDSNHFIAIITTIQQCKYIWNMLVPLMGHTYCGWGAQWFSLIQLDINNILLQCCQYYCMIKILDIYIIGNQGFCSKKKSVHVRALLIWFRMLFARPAWLDGCIILRNML